MYVDAYHKKTDSNISVVERIDGNRVYKEYPPDWHFYVKDAKGMERSIFNEPVKKIQPRSFSEKLKLMKQMTGKKYETDVNVIFRLLETKYQNIDPPDLHVAFFDIETDFDEKIGYSQPADALTPIISIAVYLQWMNSMVCLALPPPTITQEEAQAIADEVGETILFNNEKDLLDAFLDLITDADVLSGWNSEGYDITYTVNRVIKTLGKEATRRFCLWGAMPKPKVVTFGGKDTPTYDLIGRVHLDYLLLYKKYTYEERHSYKLNSIAEVELGEKKVEYEGNLDDLYKNNFKKFLEYNIQDTMLLEKLDKQLQYIDLCNTIAHANCVPIPTTMGTVLMIDQAALIEAHSRDMVIPAKTKHENDESTKAAGGWVASPKIGLHKWEGSSDLNSLYPSTIRALNMSPETIVAQVQLDDTLRAIRKFIAEKPSNKFAKWWNDRFCPLEMEHFFNNDIEHKLTLRFENGDTYQVTGVELRQLVFESGKPWCISANGTIYRTDIVGVIPGLLTRWYSERKQLQAQKYFYSTLDDSPKNENLIDMPEELFTNNDSDQFYNHASPYDVDQAYKPHKLKELIATGKKKRVVEYMNQHNLIVKDGKVIYRDQNELKQIDTFWDKRQLVKKINLNSAYGALLNVGSHFFDPRIGQSTTLTGRNITKHMAAKTNEFITGVYDHYGDAIIYGDTDSTYFSAYPILKDDIENGTIPWEKEDIIKLYDTISDEVSATFPDYMLDTFNVPKSHSEGVIKSAREIVAVSALHNKKKRYAALVYDKEGKRVDINGKPGKIKAMGLDLRRSDTPKAVQDFLSDILMDVLCDKGETYVINKIRNFKNDFSDLPSWQKGTPKAVNNLTKYKEKEEIELANKLRGMKTKSFTIPGHVKASMNWNRLREINNDHHATRITDGHKIIVCKLKESPDNLMTSVAYPIDETHLPDWFLELPFDDEAMMHAIIDKKIKNLLDVLEWDLSKANPDKTLINSLFDMSVFD